MTLLAAPPTSATALQGSERLDLSNAPVPGGMCDHPAGHLVDGERDLGSRGHEWLEDTVSSRIQGGAIAAALVGCDAGGTAVWPSTLIFYRKGRSGEPVVVASYDLYGMSRSLIDRQGPVSMTMSGHKVLIKTTFSNGCGASLDASGKFSVRGSRVVVSSLQRSNYTPAQYC